jgi:hypothetical protein
MPADWPRQVDGYYQGPMAGVSPAAWPVVADLGMKSIEVGVVAEAERRVQDWFAQGVRQGLERLVGRQAAWAPVIAGLPAPVGCSDDALCAQVQAAGRWTVWNRLQCAVEPGGTVSEEQRQLTAGLAKDLAADPGSATLSGYLRDWARAPDAAAYCDGAERSLALALLPR